MITRVRLRNYKSIAGCFVALKPLTILIGPNGAGKSNFLDGLRFTAESLRYSLEHALRDRGGIDEVRRRSETAPTPSRFAPNVRVAGAAGWYGFDNRRNRKGRYVVRREECVVRSVAPERCGYLRVRHGEASSTPFAIHRRIPEGSASTRCRRLRTRRSGPCTTPWPPWDSCRDGLFTAGELLRMAQLSPDPDAAASADIDLFRDEE